MATRDLQSNRDTTSKQASTQDLVSQGELASRGAWSSATKPANMRAHNCMHHANIMIDRTRNEQTKGNDTVDWHGECAQQIAAGRDTRSTACGRTCTSSTEYMHRSSID